MATVFMSYSHADEVMRDRLEQHLAMLKREGLVDTWHDRRIVPGQPLDPTIMGQIEEADVFLFLLSVDFISSRYCYDVEMTRALERQAAGEADVLPVVLHSCEWLQTPLGRFAGVPGDGKPIAKAAYPEDAYMEVAKALRRVVAARKGGPPTRLAKSPATPPTSYASPDARTAATVVTHPRSSNLSIRKTITDADRHSFLEGGFDLMARFFEESLAELERRNPGVEGRLRRNGADTFSARAFIEGKQAAQCRIALGGMMMGKTISFSHDANAQPGSANEILSVREDADGLSFHSMGSSSMSGQKPAGMSAQGAAELLWSLFIGSMQDSRR